MSKPKIAAACRTHLRKIVAHNTGCEPNHSTSANSKASTLISGKPDTVRNGGLCATELAGVQAVRILRQK